MKQENLPSDSRPHSSIASSPLFSTLTHCTKSSITLGQLLSSLTPQVPVDSFLPLGVQELQPKRQEIRPALPHPRETGLRIRQRSPELLRVLEINSFLAVFDEQRESVVVDGFVLLHGPARRELGVLDVLGDFAEGVAVCFKERAGDESFARDLA
jgi:hypothetical protein